MALSPAAAAAAVSLALPNGVKGANRVTYLALNDARVKPIVSLIISHCFEHCSLCTITCQLTAVAAAVCSSGGGSAALLSPVPTKVTRK